MDEIIQKLIDYAGDTYTDDQYDLVTRLVEDAVEDVCSYMYPRGYVSDTEKTAVETLAITRYPGKIRRIAQYHYDKMGKSSVTSFSENGSYATYESSDTPVSLLRGIIPIAKVV